MSKAYEASYEDARADFLRELQYAMRDIVDGEDPKVRLRQLREDIEKMAMPMDGSMS